MNRTRRLLFERHAAICQVFSHQLRLELLDALRDGELTVGELAARTDSSPSNVSQHLSLMRDRGALLSRREGSNVYYGVADPRIFAAFDMMRQLLLDRIRAEGELAGIVIPTMTSEETPGRAP